ncbi:WD repeat-containing protein 87 [Tachyglossus aculeatus]|uniref:WD repeat-containing protein 87 n=1 Tax=Tachyglossus aculeatus TaxID=9261 RepID=UPI0018F71A59|nr:WD repeat-containing protein 87 [Tachyglossus aculeatus]XP_038623366.1 WD repeat-containing protein 87 [Tachyglossus aculeatus]
MSTASKIVPDWKTLKRLIHEKLEQRTVIPGERRDGGKVVLSDRPQVVFQESRYPQPMPPLCFYYTDTFYVVCVSSVRPGRREIQAVAWVQSKEEKQQLEERTFPVTERSPPVQALVHTGPHHLLVAYCGDFCLRLFGDHTRDLKSLGTVPCPFAISSLCYDPRKGMLLSGIHGALVCWAIEPDGRSLHVAHTVPVSGRESVQGLSSDGPPGSLVALCESVARVFAWRGRSQLEEVQSFADPACGTSLTCCYTCAARGYLYTGNRAGLVQVWALNRGRRPQRFQAHQAAVVCVRSRPEAHTLLTAGSDGTVKEWNLSSSRLLRQLDLGEELQQLSFLDTSTFFCHTRCGFSLRHLPCFYHLLSACGSAPRRVQRVPCGAERARVLVSTENGLLHFLSPVTGEHLALSWPFIALDRAIDWVYAPDREELFVATGTADVLVLDAGRCPFPAKYLLQTSANQEDRVLCLAYGRPNLGRGLTGLVYCGHWSGMIQVLSQHSCARVEKYVHSGPVVALSALVGSQLQPSREDGLLCSYGADDYVHLSEAVLLEGSLALRPLTSILSSCPLQHLLLLPGSVGAVTESSRLRLWRYHDFLSASELGRGSTYRETEPLHQGPVTSFDFCPTLGILATGGADGATRLWDALGTPLAELDSEMQFGPLCFANARGDLLLTFNQSLYLVSCLQLLPDPFLERLASLGPRDEEPEAPRPFLPGFLLSFDTIFVPKYAYRAHQLQHYEGLVTLTNRRAIAFDRAVPYVVEEAAEEEEDGGGFPGMLRPQLRSLQSFRQASQAPGPETSDALPGRRRRPALAQPQLEQGQLERGAQLRLFFGQGRHWLIAPDGYIPNSVIRARLWPEGTPVFLHCGLHCPHRDPDLMASEWPLSSDAVMGIDRMDEAEEGALLAVVEAMQGLRGDGELAAARAPQGPARDILLRVAGVGSFGLGPRLGQVNLDSLVPKLLRLMRQGSEDRYLQCVSTLAQIFAIHQVPPGLRSETARHLLEDTAHTKPIIRVAAWEGLERLGLMSLLFAVPLARGLLDSDLQVRLKAREIMASVTGIRNRQALQQLLEKRETFRDIQQEHIGEESLGQLLSLRATDLPALLVEVERKLNEELDLKDRTLGPQISLDILAATGPPPPPQPQTLIPMGPTEPPAPDISMATLQTIHQRSKIGRGPGLGMGQASSRARILLQVSQKLEKVRAGLSTKPDESTPRDSAEEVSVTPKGEVGTSPENEVTADQSPQETPAPAGRRPTTVELFHNVFRSQQQGAKVGAKDQASTVPRESPRLKGVQGEGQKAPRVGSRRVTGLPEPEQRGDQDGSSWREDLCRLVNLRVSGSLEGLGRDLTAELVATARRALGGRRLSWHLFQEICPVPLLPSQAGVEKPGTEEAGRDEEEGKPPSKREVEVSRREKEKGRKMSKREEEKGRKIYKREKTDLAPKGEELDKKEKRSSVEERALTREEREPARKEGEVTVEEKEVARDERSLAGGETELAKEETEMIKEEEKLDTEEREVAKEEKEMTWEEKEMAREKREMAREEREMAREMREMAKEGKEMAREEKEMVQEERRMIKEEGRLAREEKKLARKEKEMTTEERAMAKEERELLREERKRVTDRRELARKEREMAKKAWDMAREEREMARKEREMARKEKEMSVEAKEMTREERELSREERKLSRKERSLSKEEREMAGEEREMAKEETEMSMEEKELMKEVRELAIEEKEISMIEKGKTEEKRKLPGEERELTTEESGVSLEEKDESQEGEIPKEKKDRFEEEGEEMPTEGRGPTREGRQLPRGEVEMARKERAVLGEEEELPLEKRKLLGKDREKSLKEKQKKSLKKDSREIIQEERMLAKEERKLAKAERRMAGEERELAREEAQMSMEEKEMMLEDRKQFREERSLARERTRLDREERDLAREEGKLDGEEREIKEVTQEVEKLAGEKREMPKEKKEISQEERRLSREERKMPIEMKEISQEKRKLTRKDSEMPQEMKEMIQEERRLTREERELPEEMKEMAREEKKPTGKEREIPDEIKEITQEKELAGEERETSMEMKEMIQEERELATEERKLAREMRAQSREERKLARDRRKLARNQRKLSRDQRQQARDRRKLSREDWEMISEERKPAREEKQMTGEEREIAKEEREIPTEVKEISQEERELAKEGREMPQEMQEVTQEERKPAREDWEMASEERKPAREDWEMASEERKPAMEEKVVAREERQMTRKKGETAGEEREIPVEIKKITQEERKPAREISEMTDEERKPAVEEKVASRDEKQLTREKGEMAREVMEMPREMEEITPEERKPAKEDREMTSEEREPAMEVKVIARGEKHVAREEKEIPIEMQGITQEERKEARGDQEMTSEERKPGMEEKVVARREKPMTREKREMSLEVKEIIQKKRRLSRADWEVTSEVRKPAMEEKVVARKVKQLTREKRGMPLLKMKELIQEESKLAREEREIPKEMQAITQGERKLAREERKVARRERKEAREERKLSRNQRKLSRGERRLAIEGWDMKGKESTLVPEEMVIAREEKGIAREEREMAREEREMAREEREMAREEREMAREERAMAGEENKMARKEQIITRKKRELIHKVRKVVTQEREMAREDQEMPQKWQEMVEEADQVDSAGSPPLKKEEMEKGRLSPKGREAWLFKAELQKFLRRWRKWRKRMRRARRVETILEEEEPIEEARESSLTEESQSEEEKSEEEESWSEEAESMFPEEEGEGAFPEEEERVGGEGGPSQLERLVEVLREQILGLLESQARDAQREVARDMLEVEGKRWSSVTRLPETVGENVLRPWFREGGVPKRRRLRSPIWLPKEAPEPPRPQKVPVLKDHMQKPTTLTPKEVKEARKWTWFTQLEHILTESWTPTPEGTLPKPPAHSEPNWMKMAYRRLREAPGISRSRFLRLSRLLAEPSGGELRRLLQLAHLQDIMARCESWASSVHDAPSQAPEGPAGVPGPRGPRGRWTRPVLPPIRGKETPRKPAEGPETRRQPAPLKAVHVSPRKLGLPPRQARRAQARGARLPKGSGPALRSPQAPVVPSSASVQEKRLNWETFLALYQVLLAMRVRCGEDSPRWLAQFNHLLDLYRLKSPRLRALLQRLLTAQDHPHREFVADSAREARDLAPGERLLWRVLCGCPQPPPRPPDFQQVLPLPWRNNVHTTRPRGDAHWGILKLTWRSLASTLPTEGLPQFPAPTR